MRILLLVAGGTFALAPLTKRGTPGRHVAVSSAYDVEGGDTSSAVSYTHLTLPTKA